MQWRPCRPDRTLRWEHHQEERQLQLRFGGGGDKLNCDTAQAHYFFRLTDRWLDSRDYRVTIHLGANLPLTLIWSSVLVYGPYTTKRYFKSMSMGSLVLPDLSPCTLWSKNRKLGHPFVSVGDCLKLKNNLMDGSFFQPAVPYPVSSASRGLLYKMLGIDL